MNEQVHLSRERIERLWETLRGDLTARAAAPGADADHLSSCEVCRRQWDALGDAARDLRPLMPARGEGPGSGCPSEERLLHCATGTLPAEDAAPLLEHAATCEHCGALLRMAAEDLHTEVSEAEKAAIAAMKTSQAEWRQQAAARMSAATNTGVAAVRDKEIRLKRPRTEVRAMAARSAPAPWMRWALAAAAVIVLALGSFVTWRATREPGVGDVHALLARAYTEQRPMELRIAGAEHGPIRVERSGGGRSTFQLPPALHEAQALIARRLAAEPTNPQWLAASGRAELLVWNYDAAIKQLERAQDYGDDSPDLLIDLASAYFQRGQSTPGREIDFAQAVELLGQALKKRPNDPVALFNRSVAAERSFLFNQALQDCGDYLRLDPDSRWAQEARDRIHALEEKLKKKSSSATPHWEQVVNGGQSVEPRIIEHLETYVQSVAREWLPLSVHPATDPVTAQALRSAASTVARVAEERAGDLWLKDLQRDSGSPHFPRAILELKRSLDATDRGDYQAGLQSARRAVSYFQRAGNQAGSLRAQVEEVYGLHLTSKASDCVRQASRLSGQLQTTPYRWLRIHVENERGICQNMLGLVGHARDTFLRAQELDRQGSFGITRLRTALMLASAEESIGESERSWGTVYRGLADYWRGEFPLLRGYGFYAGWQTSAERTQSWFLAVAIGGEMVRLLAQEPDLLQRAVAHDHLGRAAFHAAHHRLSETHFLEARKLYAACPPNEVTRTRQLDLEIWLARLGEKDGSTDEAANRLQQMRPQIDALQNRFVTAFYFATLAELERARGSWRAAESAYAEVIAVAERGHLSLGVGERERVSLNRIADGAYRAMVELELQHGSPTRALEIWEWFLSAPVRRNGRGQEKDLLPRPEQWPQFAVSLQSESGAPSSGLPETLISYAVLPAGLAVWVVAPDGVHAVWKPQDAASLQRMAKKFTELCGDANSDKAVLRATGRTLYDALVAPIRGKIRPDAALMIESDLLLGAVPFAALVDESGAYFGARFPITYSLGLSYLRELRPRARVNDGTRMLAVAVSRGPEGLTPLPDAEKEARAVAAHFRSSRVLVGSEATASRLERELPGVLVFHFAGHALARGEEVGLLLHPSLGEPGKPSLLSIQEAPLLSQIQMVVLSACATEKGRRGSAADSESLVRALLREGVPHVVASRWNVDSGATTAFMNAYYAELLRGQSPGGSLQAAAQHLRMVRQTEHPYYWAAFNIFGRT